jgi:hypothetical protein
MIFTLVERFSENIFINGDNSHLKGVLGRGEKGKIEIKTRKPICIYSKYMHWFPCFNFSLSYFSSTKQGLKKKKKKLYGGFSFRYYI